jgi:hypothetical protein
MATTQAMAALAGVLLAPGMVVTFEPLDPTTSLVVAGVKVGPIAVAGRRLSGSLAELTPGPFLFVPGSVAD